MKEDKIDKEFTELIREEMTGEQFWEYVSSWKDADALCDEMEEWDINTKREAIKDIKELIKNGRRL